MTDTPVVELADTVRRHKLAEVRGNPPRVHPIGRFGDRAYDHLEPAVAVCHRRRHHAPSWGCSCGFHAVDRIEDLPAVTSVLADSVVLSVELGGVLIEHDRGVRAEHQAVLGIWFPSRCSWCGAATEAVVPGRRWRSACGACAQRARRLALCRADATGALGVDVAFVDLPPEPARRRRVGAVRGVAMATLSLLLAFVALRAAPRPAAIAAIACWLGSFVLAIGTVRARSIRSVEPLFVAQCACLLVASLAVRLLL